MPKLVQITEKGITWLAGELCDPTKPEPLGFRPVYREEVRNAIVRHHLVPPHPREGRQMGFTFHGNGLMVNVWTTWLPDEGRMRESGYGWVLITDGEKILYSSPPLCRTKNFLGSILHKAKITRLRVIKRPLCPKCGQFLEIVHGPALKSTFWCCSRRAFHFDRQRLARDWDYGLPREVIRELNVERRQKTKARKRYAKRRKMEGKPPPVRAVLRHKGWRRTEEGASAS